MGDPASPRSVEQHMAKFVCDSEPLARFILIEVVHSIDNDSRRKVVAGKRHAAYAVCVQPYFPNLYFQTPAY